MDVTDSLARHPEVWFYFGVLGYATNRTLGGAGRGWPIPFALASIAVTWFLILRWTVAYMRGGGTEVFDEAYVDVLRGPHFSVSAQLLTWVAVAGVWAHEAPIHVMLFGMFGAMSAAFACWVPPSPGGPRAPTPSARWIPAGHAVGALAALYATAKLQPLSDAAYARSPPERAAFSSWLHLLHYILVIPAAFALVWPGQPRVDARWVYPLLGSVVAWGHFQDPSGTPPPP
ncbi:hypothetical protein T484DRAFT_1896410 [Baffinella frigidus]|nr:hypothetical protein T484DRAFT_1896410 [Cryptophyta sp. CCMP2293]